MTAEFTIASVLLLTLTVGLTAATPLTDKEKQEAVDSHNHLRRAVSPAASDMNMLVWDTKLELLAQKAANKCLSSNSKDAEYKNLGQNIYFSNRKDGVKEGILSWSKEFLPFDYKKNSCDRRHDHGVSRCERYTQIVHSRARKLGCARFTCDERFHPGNYILFCCYDIKHNNAQRPYKSGPACSSCHNSAMCYDGLCVAEEDQQKVVNKYKGSLTCEVVCKNCGQKQETKSASSSKCFCKCQPGWIPEDCSEYSGSNRPQPKCSKCVQQGTPCQNGGVDTNSTEKCGCSCPAHYTGPHCRMTAEVFNNSLNLQLLRPVLQLFDGKKHDIEVHVIEPRKFLRQRWPKLQSAIASSVNAYCRSNFERFRKCCPGVEPFSSRISGDLLETKDIRYVESSIRLEPDPTTLNVAFYTTAKATNVLCYSGSRDRPYAASDRPVPVSVLTAAIYPDRGRKIKGSLGPLTVKSRRAYKDVVNEVFCENVVPSNDWSFCESYRALKIAKEEEEKKTEERTTEASTETEVHATRDNRFVKNCSSSLFSGLDGFPLLLYLAANLWAEKTF